MQRAFLNESEIIELYGLLSEVIKENKGINMGGGKKRMRTKRKKRGKKTRRKNTKKRARKSRR
jgi:hypothetical protein